MSSANWGVWLRRVLYRIGRVLRLAVLMFAGLGPAAPPPPPPAPQKIEARESSSSEADD
jgi:hypothetical protein